MNSCQKVVDFVRASIPVLTRIWCLNRRHGLYGRLFALIERSRKHVGEDLGGNGYALEKCGNLRHNITEQIPESILPRAKRETRDICAGHRAADKISSASG